MNTRFALWLALAGALVATHGCDSHPISNPGGATSSGGIFAATTSSGGAGGTALDDGGLPPVDGAALLADVVSLEMPWSTNADAGAPWFDVVALPDGSATCRKHSGGTVVLSGHIDGPDAEFQALLGRPGAITELGTLCPLRLADVESTITTTFATGTQVSRLVFGSCSDDTLAAIVAALRRIGDACIASGTAGCQSSLDDFKCVSGGTNWCCPATLADTTSPLPCPGYEMRSSGACTSERTIFTRSWGTHGIQCYYSVATGALAGATKFDDVPSYCASTSSTISGGENPSCDQDALIASAPCKADAGAGSQ